MGKNDIAQALAAKYNKEYGPGAVMIASEMHVPVRFTSGSLSLDASLSGGWAGNQWAEVFGPENNGKTAITLKTLAANQARDPEFHALWIASEHYDLDQATALGVDTDRVSVFATQDMTTGYDVVLDYLTERAADMVVIDSYPAMIPPDEDSKDMGEYTQAEGAKMTNKFFRKVGKAGLRNPADPGDRPWLGLFVNQPREKIGGFTKPGMPPPETTPGGRGKNFAFYTRLKVQRTEWIVEGDKRKGPKVGQVIKTQPVKHKGGPPERVAFLDFYFTDSPQYGRKRGEYDVPKDVLTTAVLFDVIHKGGGWYSFQDQQWQGITNVLESLRGDSDLMDRVSKGVYAALDDPSDKRTYNDADVISAGSAKTVVRRRKKGADSEN